jgi:hypothetical protein
MNKKIFIRYDSHEGDSWSAAMEGVNNRVNTPGYTPTIDVDFFKLGWNNQTATYLGRSNNTHQMFKTHGETPDAFLSIGRPAFTENQTVSVQTVNTDKIFAALDNPNYKAVYFGYFSPDGEFPSDLEIMPVSGYYARNIQTQKMENVVTGEQLSEDDNVQFVFWYCVYKINQTNIYYLVVNPNLVDINRDIEGTFNNADFYLLSSYNEDLRKSVFLPTVTGGAKIGDNVIVATGNLLTIDALGYFAIIASKPADVYELSQPIPQDQLPPIELLVESSEPYTVNNNLITVDVSSASITTIRYRIVTNTEMDYLNLPEQSLKYEFVIVKKG